MSSNEEEINGITELPPVNIIWHDTESDFYYEKQFGPYCVLSKLGQGAFGVVKAGEDTVNHRQVAIKLIDKTGLNELDQQSIKTEAEVMSYLHHQNVVSLYSVFESSRQICMVMEYAGGGDLMEHVLRQTKISEVEARKLFVQLVNGLGYTHSRRIVHRDIKAQNIFLDEKLETVKIGDWGFATLYTPGVSLGNPCGTLHYAAPEILTQDPYLGPEIDVWALGAVLYFMVSGLLPFRGSTDFEVFSKIKRGEYRSLPMSASDDLKDIIHQIFNIDRKKRVTLEQLKNHPWCEKARLDPEYLKRPKLPRLLQHQIRHYRSKSENLSPRNSTNDPVTEPILIITPEKPSKKPVVSEPPSSKTVTSVPPSSKSVATQSSSKSVASEPSSSKSVASQPSSKSVTSQHSSSKSVASQPSSSKSVASQPSSSKSVASQPSSSKSVASEPSSSKSVASEPTSSKSVAEPADKKKHRDHEKSSRRRKNEGESSSGRKERKPDSEKSQRKGKRRKDKTDQAQPKRTRHQIDEEEEVEEQIEAEDLTLGSLDFFDQIDSGSIVKKTEPPKQPPVHKPSLPRTTSSKFKIPVPAGGRKTEQTAPEEALPASSAHDNFLQESPQRIGRRPSKESLYISMEAVRKSQPQQIRESHRRRPSLEVPLARSNRTLRSSFRKSTYTMLRVDSDALQEIKSARDVELLSVETAETGEHVVFVSAKTELGQETQALEKLKRFEANGTRLTRPKSTIYQPSSSSKGNRRSIFLSDVSKMLSSMAEQEVDDLSSSSPTTIPRTRRAMTYNITDTAKQPELPATNNNQSNNNNHMSTSANQASWHQKRSREARGAGKWNSLTTAETDPPLHARRVSDVAEEDSSNEAPAKSSNDSKPVSWTQPDKTRSNSSSQADFISKEKLTGRKPMKLVVTTPMGSRRTTDQDQISPYEDT